MKDWNAMERGRGAQVGVRNCWATRTSERSRPDHVLVDVGVDRGNGAEWNCAQLTPRQARAMAAALIRAADDTEGK